MTFTITVLRDDIKEDLRDSSNATWTTAQLDRAIDEALRRYTIAAPRPRSSALTGISGRTVTLSAAAPAGLGTTDYAALIRVHAAEYPVGEYPARWARFNVYGATLYLHVDSELASEAVTLYWDGQHTLDGSSGTIPDQHRDILALGSVGYALRQLGQYSTGTVNVSARYATDLRAYADDHLRRFDDALRQVRAQRGPIVRTMYRGQDQLSDSDVVAWPD